MKFQVLLRCVGDEGHYTKGRIVKAPNALMALMTMYLQLEELGCLETEDQVMEVYINTMHADTPVGEILPPEIHQLCDRFRR